MQSREIKLMPDTTDATPTSTTNHLYDNSELNSLEFLAAVMHSVEVPIEHRIAAAEALLPFVKAKPLPSIRPLYVNGIPTDQDVMVKIVIQEMPALASVAVEHDMDRGLN
jgi:hypothetical protein